MAIIKCNECDKDVSDKATTCPNCGNPINAQSNVVIGINPKRRRYKIKFLIFLPMFFLGSMATFGSLFSGNKGGVGIWFLIGVIGFIGIIYSSIGHWLAQP